MIKLKLMYFYFIALILVFAFLLFNTTYASTIVMIPGSHTPKDGWNKEFIKNLSANNTLIFIDNKGSSIRQMVNNIKLNDTVNIIGYSMGGMIAQELALISDKISKLVLISTHCGNGIPSEDALKYYHMRDSKEKSKLGLKVLYTEKWLKNNPEFVQEYLTKSRNDYEINSEHSRAIRLWQGVCDELNNIQVPTLILVGDKDQVTPKSNSEYIHRNIPVSNLTVLKNAGHGIISQYPDTTSSKILDFLG